MDFIKGLAILTIVLMHFLERSELGLPAFAQTLVRFGGTGLHLFFLASGFGLALSHFKRKSSIKGFYRKRLSKIYLPYVAVVTVIALVNLIIPMYGSDVTGGHEGQSGWMAYLSHIFLFKMFNEQWMTSYGYHLWFISTIIQFYLIFPFLARLRDKYPMLVYIGSLVVSLIWSTLVVVLGKAELRIWNSFFLQYLWEFVLGMAMAKIYYTHGTEFWRRSTVKSLTAGTLFSGAYAGLALFFGPAGKVFNDIPALFGYGLLAITLYNLKLPFIQKFILYVGQVSYGLYLTHMLIWELSRRLLEEMGIGYSVMSAFWIATLAISLAYPIQKGLNRL